jgi:hypothetical protein
MMIAVQIMCRQISEGGSCDSNLKDSTVKLWHTYMYEISIKALLMYKKNEIDECFEDHLPKSNEDKFCVEEIKMITSSACFKCEIFTFYTYMCMY